MKRIHLRLSTASLAFALVLPGQRIGPLFGHDIRTVQDSVVTRSVATVKVAKGVYAFVAPETFGALVSGNSLVAIGDSAVLVVDSGHFPTVTRQMIATIRTLTKLPVRYLVNTHWHPDHWMGNAEYQRAFPGITIISTVATRDEIERQGPTYIASYQDTATIHRLRELATGTGGASLSPNMRAYYTATIPDLDDAMAGWRDVRLVGPTITFDKRYRVSLGARHAEVMFLGRGNTEGDAIVVVPDVGVIATGDLVVNPTPYAYDSYIGEWIGVLKQIIAMAPAVIVPGHGPIQHDLQYIHSLLALFSYVQDRTALAVKQGMSLGETRTFVDLEKYRKQFAGSDLRRRLLFDIGFADPGLEGAYNQAIAHRKPTRNSP